MLRLAWGIWLKDRITIADKVMVFVYAYRTEHAKSRRERIAYLKQIVRVFTGKRFVWLRDLLYVNRMLDECGMLKRTNKENKTIEQMRLEVINLCSEIGSRCGKTPHEIMVGMTDKEIELFSLHLLLRQFERAADMAASHAAPAAHGEVMLKKSSEYRSKINDVVKGSITPEELPEALSIKGMFKWA